MSIIYDLILHVNIIYDLILHVNIIYDLILHVNIIYDLILHVNIIYDLILHVNIIMLFVFLGEWIAGAVCMYTAFRLVSEYGVKEDVTTLLNTLEIVLVPMVNPDGYAVSWEV